MDVPRTGGTHGLAVQAMDFFVKMLRKASDDIATGVDPTKPPADSTAAEVSKTAASVSSFLGWAMTTVSAVSSASASAAAPKPATEAAARPSGGAADAPRDAGSGGGAMRPGGAAERVLAAAASPQGAAARPEEEFDDGWGDDDDLFEDMENDGAVPDVDASAVVAAAQDIAKVQPSLEPIRTSGKPASGACQTPSARNTCFAVEKQRVGGRDRGPDRYQVRELSLSADTVVCGCQCRECADPGIIGMYLDSRPRRIRLVSG